MLISSEEAAAVPANRSNIIRHRRWIICLTEGPVQSWSTFVTKEGITSSAAATGRGMNKLINPIATVGRPIPVTPFTKPARINISKR